MSFTVMMDDEYDVLPLSDEQQKSIEKFTPVSPLFCEHPSLLKDVVRHVCVKRANWALPEHKMEVYTLMEGFCKYDRYWVTKVRQDRMEGDWRVLYRPNITNTLFHRVEALLNASTRKGIMVKGPQGVGKSFSIVNLVRKLLSSDRYVVTFIPHCDLWRSLVHLYWYILSSVGVDESSFLIKYGNTDYEASEFLKALIRNIDEIVNVIGKRWVFVFDQINRIFGRPAFAGAKRVGDLPFPYDAIQSVMVPGRILSILCASANSEASHRDHHVGFEEFNHDIALSADETQMLFPKISSEAEYYTGFVPLYLRLYDQAESIGHYVQILSREISKSLGKLKDQSTETEWRSIVQCAISFLLRIPKDSYAWCYDRNYSFTVVTEDSEFVAVLFPMVEEAYHYFFGEELMQYIKRKEENLLVVCDNPRTTTDTRGRLFEMIALRRLSSRGLKGNDINKLIQAINPEKSLPKFEAQVLLPAGPVQYIQGNGFPTFLPGGSRASLYIPTSPNYPAIDAIVRTEEVAIAFQAHVSDHKDVKDSLLSNARAAGWFSGAISTIVLVYLSPHPNIANALRKKLGTKAWMVEKGRRTFSGNCEYDVDVFTFFCSTNEFTTIGFIPWSHSE